MGKEFTISDEEKQILSVAMDICARVMSETNGGGDNDPGPIFTEASFSVTALHTFLYYMDEDDPMLLRKEPALARLRRFMVSLDDRIDEEDYNLVRTTMLQINSDLYDLFPELRPKVGKENP